ncbi:50S ribosomal protein L24e [Candidatus Gugararchaeum adminiculabundum]|nr:50S ribosomal protein L24e [Candidatus Gugararchaeum adminiculabundum]
MKCSFCTREVEKGTGVLFVKKDGTTLGYCSTKCRRNVGLGRKRRTTTWAAKIHTVERIEDKTSAAAKIAKEAAEAAKEMKKVREEITGDKAEKDLKKK